jgi:ATP-dependent protease ClpP protease subunit
METLSINGTIGTAVTADSVRSELARIGPVPLTVKINSEGGSVSEGVTIYELLRQHPAAVTVDIDGWALSIASVIAMAGKKIRMAPAALMMVHTQRHLSVLSPPQGLRPRCIHHIARVIADGLQPASPWQ